MVEELRLTKDDPTVFAKCSGRCCVTGKGTKVGFYYGKAFTRKEWSRGPVCPNCESSLQIIYEVMYA